MVLQAFWVVFGLVVTVSIIAIGAYIGTLRALDTFYGDGNSIFLSQEFHGRQER